MFNRGHIKRRSNRSRFAGSLHDNNHELLMPAQRRPVKSRKNQRKFLIHSVTAISCTCMFILFILNPLWHRTNPASALKPKPHILICHFRDFKDSSGKHSKMGRIKHLPIHDEDRYPSKRQVEWTVEDENSQIELQNSKKYKRNMALRKEPNSDRCFPSKWLSQYIPNCNKVHEHDFTQFYIDGSSSVEENLRLVAHGFWRDVWKSHDEENSKSWLALKTMRWSHDFHGRNFERHRRDAIATERATASPYIANIYAYCGFTTIADFANEGSLSDLIWPEEGESKLTTRERLDFALQVAKGLAALHFLDKSDNVLVAHTDITPSQFLLSGDTLQLNDFNRGRFISYEKDGTACPFRVGINPGKFRSPEEYKKGDENEKVDVYSMGNVFYCLLTEKWPFEEIAEDKAMDKVTNGERPPIPMMNSTDAYEQVLMNAMKMSWAQEAVERPDSKKIMIYLEEEIKRLNNNAPGRDR